MWDALIAARPAGRSWQPADSAAGYCALIPDDYRRHPQVPANLPHLLDRGSLIALDAALQAIDSAGLGAGAGDSRRFALADGEALRAPGQPTLFVPYGQTVARALGIRGTVEEVGGGMASGMAAIAAASRLVAQGEADVVIAGAAQALQPPLLEHFAGQGWVDDEGPRPFDTEHAGFVPAEGAAYVVVESSQHARERGARAVASISGIAQVFDPGVEPLAVSEAAEAGRAMQLALGDAGYLQNQVDVIVSCADGRPLVDFAEGYGIRRVFGNHAYYASLTAPAGTLGNALAASGPLALVVALEAMRRQQTPPLTRFETPAQDLEQLAYVREAKEERVGCVLVTCLGLGGVNTALVLDEVRETATRQE